jgi:L-threonylcarbamoyladenylate synthase
MEASVTGFLSRFTLKRVAAVLSSGGIAVLPTDTLYGLHCRAFHPTAVEKIRILKRIHEGKGFILLASDLRMVEGLVSHMSGEARKLLARIWPAPLTVILPSTRKIPMNLAPRGRVAIRVPGYNEFRSLITLVGEPLVSTSVNITGQPQLTRIEEIKKAFPGIDAYISRRGRKSTIASTIVDFTVHPPRLIRSGRYPWPPKG